MSSKSIQILFIADSPPSTEVLIKNIEECGNFVVSKRVENAEQIELALKEHEWDVVISSDKLEKLSAQKAIQITRNCNKDLPIVIISQAPHLAIAGANDSIRFDDLGRLAPTIAREIYYANLQKRICELEKKLRLSQKMADLGKFASSIAHDFNNIMTVIMGNCENMISETSSNDTNYKPLKRLYHNAERGSKLVDQILNYLRQKKNHSEAICLNDIISNLSSFLQQLIGKDIYINIKLAQNLPKVILDIEQFEQILINLCSNAKDAITDGGTIFIETTHEEIFSTSLIPGISPNHYCVLTFKDTGCGMPPEIQKNVFTPFFTTKPPTHGTGLGLSIIQEAVHANKGHISFSSKINEGTTFKIYFPAL